MKEMRKVLNELLEGDITPGEVLRDARVSLGISQAQLYDITGVNRENISAIENGRIEMTSRYALLFGVALNIHPADLLFPNGKFVKSSDLIKVERKAKELLKKISS